MRLPSWLKSFASNVLWPLLREEAKVLIQSEIESLRLKHGPAVVVPPGTTGPSVLHEEQPK